SDMLRPATLLEATPTPRATSFSSGRSTAGKGRKAGLSLKRRPSTSASLPTGTGSARTSEKIARFSRRWRSARSVSASKGLPGRVRSSRRITSSCVTSFPIRSILSTRRPCQASMSFVPVEWGGTVGRSHTVPASTSMPIMGSPWKPRLQGRRREVLEHLGGCLLHLLDVLLGLVGQLVGGRAAEDQLPRPVVEHVDHQGAHAILLDGGGGRTRPHHSPRAAIAPAAPAVVERGQGPLLLTGPVDHHQGVGRLLVHRPQAPRAQRLRDLVLQALLREGIPPRGAERDGERLQPREVVALVGLGGDVIGRR